MIRLSLKNKERLLLSKGYIVLHTIKLLKIVTSFIGCRGVCDFVEKRLILKTKLFNESWYLNNYREKVKFNSAIKHYVTEGDMEGVCPMPLFDSRYYSARINNYYGRVNNLLHYYYVGRYLGISPSSWFDVEYYQRVNKDVRRDNIDPLYHFVNYGVKEGRKPLENFDHVYFDDMVSDSVSDGLAYYYSGMHSFKGLNVSSIDEESELNHIVSRLNAVSPILCKGEPEIDIIIPIYRDAKITLKCILSVLEAKYKTAINIILINDASPDSFLSDFLKSLADAGKVSLIENTENLGFVKTVNIGMRLHENRNVVLLNSDTEVYNDWLDRIYSIGQKDNDIATITPLSNSATICSYPKFDTDNPFPLEVTYKELDCLASLVNTEGYVEAPTGVGFCMYISRNAINKMGVFDCEAFGKGYGEENDFCQRAIGFGLKNVIAANVFVYHVGGVSFQQEKNIRIKRAMDILRERYPNYLKDVSGFISQDPLSIYRKNLDFQRLKSYSKEKNVLTVCHSRGGGTERHLHEDAEKLIKQGIGVYLMRPLRGGDDKVSIEPFGIGQFCNLDEYSLRDLSKLAEDMMELSISGMQIHSLVDFSPRAPALIADLAETIGVPFEVDIHDYKVICPRINLVDKKGFYCYEPKSEKNCDRCLKKNGSDFGVYSIKKWRDSHKEVLEKASKITVPDEDVALRLERYYPMLKMTIEAHDTLEDERGRESNYSSDRSELNVVVVGGIGKLKGFDVLLNCAKDVKNGKGPINYKLLGYSLNDSSLRKNEVVVTGKYDDHEAIEMLKELEADFVFLPSLWPETYSYTLSIALKYGAPIIAFDIGAIASRLKRSDIKSLLLPLHLARDSNKINSLIIDFARQQKGFGN